MDTNTDEEIIENTQEETITTLQEEIETDESSEESIDWKAEALKYKEIANDQRGRAERLEQKFKKTETPKVAPKKSSDLSTLDIIAISKANIDTEDVEEVVEYARFKGISVSEALKSPVIKTTLSQKEEMRKTAQATSTGSTRRGSSMVSDEKLLSDAKKGILPESDADIERLAKLQVNRKR